MWHSQVCTADSWRAHILTSIRLSQASTLSLLHTFIRTRTHVIVISSCFLLAQCMTCHRSLPNVTPLMCQLAQKGPNSSLSLEKTHQASTCGLQCMEDTFNNNTGLGFQEQKRTLWWEEIADTSYVSSHILFAGLLLHPLGQPAVPAPPPQLCVCLSFPHISLSLPVNQPGQCSQPLRSMSQARRAQVVHAARWELCVVADHSEAHPEHLTRGSRRLSPLSTTMTAWWHPVDGLFLLLCFPSFRISFLFPWITY